jgi:hypothetical protein
MDGLCHLLSAEIETTCIKFWHLVCWYALYLCVVSKVGSYKFEKLELSAICVDFEVINSVVV